MMLRRKSGSIDRKKSTADRRRWIIRLPLQPVGVGHTLEISEGNHSITLKEIAFGDVFARAGLNVSSELDDCIHCPNMRVASVYKAISSIPHEDVGSSYIWGPVLLGW